MVNGSKICDDMASDTDAGMNYCPRIHAQWEDSPLRGLDQGLLAERSGGDTNANNAQSKIDRTSHE